MSQRIITIPFTSPFIETLADYIYDNDVLKGKDLSKVLIVFGGRRPAMFLRRALGKRIKQSYVPPAIKTIDEVMTTIAQHEQPATYLNDLDNAYIIFNLVKKVAPHLLRNRERFAPFLPWAREIAAFIEQIDLQALPQNPLTAVSAQAKIGYDVPIEINELLVDLGNIRQAYHAHLIEHQLTGRGFDYLKASQVKEDIIFQAYDKVIFANFFYLHRTEMAVIKRCYDQGKAVLVMQGDERRWPALKRIGRVFNTPIVEGKEVKETSFDLKLYTAQDLHTQAGIIAQILKQVKEPDKTVIVLPDPDFLLPLLSAIGEHLGEFNISLGYPLKRSSLFTLLSLIINLQQTARDGKVYTRDYLRLLHHPLVKHFLDVPLEVADKIINTCDDVLTGKIMGPLSGCLFISPDDIARDQGVLAGFDNQQEIQTAWSKFHTLTIKRWFEVNTFNQLSDVLTDFIDAFNRHAPLTTYPFNQAVLLLLQDVNLQYRHLQFTHEPIGRDELFRIFLESLSREVVGFSGSPLRGLQVLGLFETRSLNFDYVIVANSNEGVLPNLNIYEPLIPREVMIKLNVDRLELEEEIQRYGFMRLIAAAKEVHLVYLDKADKVPSRFVEELVWEKENRAQQLGIIVPQTAMFKSQVMVEEQQAVKTPAIIDFLKAFTFSASSLDAYVHNPYEFYINYVLGLRQQEDLLDDPDGRQVGTFIHALLEQTYKPFIGKTPRIDEAFIQSFFKQFEHAFKQYFGQSGRADIFMFHDIMRVRLKRFLEAEANRSGLVSEILFLEKKFTDSLDLETGKVRLTYRVDRVDKLNDGTVMIVDYKTGSSDIKGSFQMPLYIDYLSRVYPNQPINAAIYHLRTAGFETFINSQRGVGINEVIKEHRVLLTQTMEEILNPDIPFAPRALIV